MARIPVYQERQQISQLSQISEARVPDSGAGLIGRSMQQVGQALGQVAQTVSAIEQENGKAWAAQTAGNEMLFWTQRSQELKQELGPSGAGYVTKINEEFQKRADVVIAEAPEGSSRRYLSQNLLNLRNTLLGKAIEYEAVEGRAYRVDSIKKGIEATAFAIAQNPDPVMAENAIGEQLALIDSMNLLPREKRDLQEYVKKSAANAYWSSLAQTNPAAVNVALSANTPNVKGDLNASKLFSAMQTVESNNNPNAIGRETRFGKAVGLMQVLPSTAMDPGFGLPNIFDFAKSKGVAFGGPTEESAKTLLQDPKIGAEYGQAYMKAMLGKYNGNVVYALAAYNWGPGATDNWIAQGANMESLPKETQKYIPKVLGMADISVGQSGGSQNPMLSYLSLGDQLKILQSARANESAQIVESTTSAVFRQFGPQSDTDPIELDLMNQHIDVLMAGRTAAERGTAKTLLKQYADAFKASASQRQAERVSGIWTNVLNGAPMSEIVDTPMWKSLNGTEQKKLITEINSFRTQPTQPAQWAAYEDIKSNPAALAAMSPEQILAMAPELGNELTTKLIQDRSKLNTPEGLAEVKYDEDSFKVFASKAGLKVFDSKIGPVEKEKIGQFRYAVETAIDVRQAQLKRPLSRAEQEEVMAEVMSNTVYVNRWGRDPEVMMALVSKDDIGNTYVNVGTKQVYLKDIPASDRAMIIRQLQSAGLPITEASIAEVWFAAQEKPPTRQPREIDPTGFGAIIQ
jgi:soluble lytic murein transglycosylase-like protein